ncbi:MAG: NDP-sugar synthase [Actinomycetota bacterium]|nr:NDP-sugar synthase [Actinomycetota bacterium]
MEAILLVGGQGSRLRPLTVTTPKPMLPAAGVPFLLHQLARARDAGVDHVLLSTSYRSDVFEDYFGDGSSLGLDLEYVVETEPLGTGGGIRNAAERLRARDDEPVLVFNGDVLSGMDVRALVERHTTSGADVSLYLTRVDDPRAFGLVPTDRRSRVTAFLEKPTRPEDFVTDQVNAGCYVFRRSVIDRIPAGRAVSVELETFPALLREGAFLLGHVDPAYWLDLGTPAAFVKGCTDLVLGRVPSSALPGPTGECLVLPGASIGEDAGLLAGTVVGSGVKIHQRALLDGAVVFDGATIGAGTVVRRSVVGRGAVVGPGCVLVDAVVGDGATVGARCELRAGARVWTGAVLAESAVRFSPD